MPFASRTTTSLAVLAIAAGICARVESRQRGAPALAVSALGAPFHPGDVALLTISSPAPVDRVSVSAFGKELAAWPSATTGQWQALAGIALDTKPGRYTVRVRGIAAGVESSPGLVTLTVQSKVFDTRRLTVESRFVDPPQSEGERIARETALLVATFARSSPRFWSGPFQQPVPGRATSSFGRLTVLNGEPRTRHQGADFTAATGTEVRAPNGGEVAVAEDLYFSGNTVILDHGAGLFSLLAHLSRIDVKPGARVARGDLLGESGATGRVTGPHLHWAVRLGEISVDPMSLMKVVAGTK